MGKIGVINEIGDLGLGFDELSEKDQKALNEQQQKPKQTQQNPNEKKDR